MRVERAQVPFVGRQHELAELRELIFDRGVRVITLVGPGGVGKSRLTRELATQVDAKFTSEARVVDLALATCPEAVYEAFAETLGLPSPLVGKEFMPRDMNVRHGLTIIDNAEQVAVSVAKLLRLLLPCCPGLQFLVTSREPLHLYSEQIFPVRPLPVAYRANLSTTELAKVPSIRLFLERARQVQPGYRLTAEDAQYLREICLLLDGLPLAIELAASRMKLFRPRALLTRLRDSLDVLEHGLADKPSRQRSLCAAIAWSFNLLTREQIDMLCSISIFAGGFDLPAVQAVTGATPRIAERVTELLVDKSVISIADHQADGEPRFEMLRTMRTYTRDRLHTSGRAEVVASRHAEHFLERARAAGKRLNGPDQATLLKSLARDHDNFYLAFRHLVERGEIATAVRLIADLHRYIIASGHVSEAHRWLQNILGGGARSVPGAESWLMFGTLCASIRQDARAKTHLGTALARFREAGNSQGGAQALSMLGHLALIQGDLDQAEKLWVESQQLLDEVDTLASYPSARGGMALLALLRGDLSRAEELCAEQMKVCAEQGDTTFTAICSIRTGLVRAARRDFAAAASLYGAGIRQFESLKHLPGLAFGIEALVLLESTQDGPARYLRAARLLGAAESIRSAACCVFPTCGPGLMEQARTSLRQLLGGETFERERQAGRALSLSDAVAEALSADHVPVPERDSMPMNENLTAREREVAELVAQGRTNRQVAAELAISEWTAINHLRHVMRKLDCRSRIEVAQWVLGSGNRLTKTRRE